MLNFIFGFTSGICVLLIFAYKMVQNELKESNDDWQREIDIDTDFEGGWIRPWKNQS